MPLQKLQFKPGVNRESTNYSNEGGWFDIDKARFRSGFPQKLGGWVSISDTSLYTYKGVCRILWNWVTLGFANLAAVGTNQKYYIENGGRYFDITPLRVTATINTDPFATTNGSKLVTVTDTSHGTSAGTFVTYSGASAVAGLTLNGEYEVISVIDGNTYTIVSATAANATTTGGGAAVSAAYQINAGNATYTTGTGWGAGVWSRGTWGSATTVGVAQQLLLWSNDNFGENLVFAQRGGEIYYWEVDTSTYPRGILLADAADNAGYVGDYVPNSTYQVIASGIQRFALAIGSNPYDPADTETTFDPMLVRWSDQENEFDWVPTTSNQSGEQRLAHGSLLVCAEITRQEILIWSDTALYSMQYLGPPYVWGFTVLMDNISIISPQAATTVNNVTFWMGVDKFFSYAGRVETIPCTVRQYVFGDLNKDQAFQIVSGSNEGFSEVWWLYPSADSQSNNRYVIFNYLENIWYYGTINRTAWLDSPLRQFPMAAFSVQNSYLDTAIDSTITSIPLLNASSYPNEGTIIIESEKISYTSNNGSALSGCVRGVDGTTAASHAQYVPVTYIAANQLIYHETGVDDGIVNPPLPMESYIQSSDFDIGDGHNFGFVWRILPDITFDGSTATTPTLNMVVKPRQNSGTQYGTPDAPRVERTATYPVEQFTGQVYTRIRGRQMAYRIESTETGVNWQLGTPRIDIRPDGRR